MLGLIALCGWLVRCLIQTTRESSTSTSTAISTTTKRFSEILEGQTKLTEVLLLGREDSRTTSETSPSSSTDVDPLERQEIDSSSLPESAQWAMEEEMGLQLNEMPWQSSKPLDDLES